MRLDGGGFRQTGRRSARFVNSRQSALLPVQVVLAMPEVQYLCDLEIPPGTTARETVLMALEVGLIPGTATIDITPSSAPLGVFGERVDDDYPCVHGDRVEIYRPLQQDPKELRRQRARQSSS